MFDTVKVWVTPWTGHWFIAGPHRETANHPHSHSTPTSQTSVHVFQSVGGSWGTWRGATQCGKRTPDLANHCTTATPSNELYT